MSAIPGSVRIAGFVAPTDSTDTYPTHDDVYGKGGFRPVVDVTARDAISSDRRKEGMWVKCLSDGKVYTLSGGITNGHWVEQTMGGGDSITSDVTYYVDGTTGNDSNDGLSWLTAKKTLGFLILGESDSLPHEINADVTIYVRNDIRARNSNGQFWITGFYGSGSITIEGVLTAVETFTATGYENNPNVQGSMQWVSDGTKTWVPDQWRRHFVDLGHVTHNPIRSNNGTTLYIGFGIAQSGSYASTIYSAPEILRELDSAPGVKYDFTPGTWAVLQNCTIPINISKLWLDEDYALLPRLSIMSCPRVHFENVSFSGVYQEFGYFSLAGCYINVKNYGTVSVKNGIMSCGYVTIDSTDSTGYGLFLNGASSCSLTSVWVGRQLFGLWATPVSRIEIFRSVYLQGCEDGIVLDGGALFIVPESTLVLRFDTMDRAIVGMGNIAIELDATVIGWSCTKEIVFSDTDEGTFLELSSKTLQGRGQLQISYTDTDYHPVLLPEYDNTISGLTSTRYKTAIDEVALSVTSRLVEFSDTTIDLIDDTDFTATEASASVTEGAGYTIEITSTTATGNLTVILYQDAARLQPVYTMNVDLTDTDTYRSAEAFGFDLETTGTIYGTAFVSGVPLSQTFNITISATPIQSTGTPTPLPSPYGNGIEDDGTGKPRVALASNSGLQFSAGKLVVDADTGAAIYPVLGAGGISITGAVDTTTTQSVSAKKLFSAVGATPLTASGAPTSGTYAEGHIICDLDNVYWTCVTAGTPGTWELFSSVYETPTDLATASLTYGTSELLSIPVVGNVGTIQRLQIWGVVAAVAEYSIPFRARVYENKNERGRDLIWQGNGLARQTNLSGTLNAGLVAVPVNDNNVADIDEAIVIFESVSRYELGRVVGRPTGEFTLDEALVDGSSWAADVYVAVASEWVNVPFVNTEAASSDQKKIYLQIRHDGIATDPAITFYVKVTTHSVGVIR